MEEKELTRVDFYEEIKMMAVSCIGVKESTALRKAREILNKYQDLISYSVSYRERNSYHSEFIRYRSAFRVLKSGTISYTKKPSGTEGYLRISDIQQVEIRQDDVVLITKAGREIVLSSDFKFLEEVFRSTID